jgi:sugar phosphate isomerase/epimerase
MILTVHQGTIVSLENLPSEVDKIATSGKLVKAGNKPTAWKLVTKWIEETLQTLEKLSIGVELWNNPDVQTIVIRQNRRIHSRL